MPMFRQVFPRILCGNCESFGAKPQSVLPVTEGTVTVIAAVCSSSA